MAETLQKMGRDIATDNKMSPKQEYMVFFSGLLRLINKKNGKDYELKP